MNGIRDIHLFSARKERPMRRFARFLIVTFFGLFHPAVALAYLHPTLGRFLSRDRAGYSDSVDLYEYSGCAPVNSVDPFGLASATTSTSQGSGAIYDGNKISEKNDNPEGHT